MQNLTQNKKYVHVHRRCILSHQRDLRGTNRKKSRTSNKIIGRSRITSKARKMQSHGKGHRMALIQIISRKNKANRREGSSNNGEA